MTDILFQETQRFTQRWLFVIVIATTVIVLASILPVINDVDGLANQIIVVAIVLFFIALTGSIFFMRLETTITEKSICMRFHPFVKREWHWENLRQARVIDYGFIGGYGIRLWTGYGTVYNIKGTKGLHFKTADKEYIIGTQKPEELEQACHHLMK